MRSDVKCRPLTHVLKAYYGADGTILTTVGPGSLTSDIGR